MNKVIFLFLSICLAFLLACFFTTAKADAGATCSFVKRLPTIDITLWAGDSDNAAIVRQQDRRGIQCKEPEFNQYTCLTYADLKKVYSTILRCKKWGDVEDIVAAEDLHLEVPRPIPMAPLPSESRMIDFSSTKVSEGDVVLPGQMDNSRKASVVDWKEVL